MLRILALDQDKFASVTYQLNTNTNQAEFWPMSADRRYVLMAGGNVRLAASARWKSGRRRQFV